MGVVWTDPPLWWAETIDVRASTREGARTSSPAGEGPDGPAEDEPDRRWHDQPPDRATATPFPSAMGGLALALCWSVSGRRATLGPRRVGRPRCGLVVLIRRRGRV
ncbi:hypothetical protein GCM10009780_10040 [Actinomadura alba]